jgi:hypothetical protein
MQRLINLILLLGIVTFTMSEAIGAGLRDGLIGYWPLDNLEANDASGNGRDGVINGFVEAEEDRFGNAEGAMLFSGFSGDHVDLGDDEAFRLTGAMSVAAWVVLDSSNANNGRIIAKSGGGGSRAWSLNIESGNSDPTFQIAIDGGNNLSVSDPDPLPLDEWAHMVGVYRPGEQTEMYVNGELKGILDVDVPDEQYSDNGLPVLIGARNECDNCGWVGAIDDVALWSRALSDLEVADLYENGIDGGPLVGDFSADGALNAADIDQLTMQAAGGQNPPTFDLNQDAAVNRGDVGVWVRDLFGTWMGDANLDGQFNSSDLVAVLASGTYEANVAAVWSTGDFNGDGRTTSSDLVVALADGGYELGPRAAAAAVPEPLAKVLISLGALGISGCRRWRKRHVPTSR